MKKFIRWVILILREILSYLDMEKTTDIHICEDESLYFRAWGDMVKSKVFIDRDKFTEIMDEIFTDQEVKSIENFTEVNKTLSLDGHRFRINGYLYSGKKGIAIRVLQKEIIDLEKLGIRDYIESIMKADHNGLLIVTGKTGSGKTTTVSSIISYINKHYKKHVISLEDPIEYIFKSDQSLINQRELGRDFISYGKAIEESLRHDVDILSVGEMRTEESLRKSITAAETGHLVIGTLHTKTAEETIDRIIDAFPHGEKLDLRSQLASNIRLIISQELVYEDGSVKAKMDILEHSLALENLIRKNKLRQVNSLGIKKKL